MDIGAISRVVGVVLIAYLALTACAYVFQRNLIYFPDRNRIAPEAVGLSGVEEVEFNTPDGEQLIGWYRPPPDGRPLVLYFHGNGGNIAYRADRVAWLARQNYGVLIIDYRGYGGSTGTPSEEGLYVDGRASVRFLADRGVPLDKTVFYGESLGSAVAVKVAAEVTPAAIILEAPFTSAADVGARAYPFLPVRALMKDRFAAENYISKVKIPVLVLHGVDDRIVPIELGRELFELAQQPKHFVELEGGHDDVFSRTGRAEISGFVERYVSRSVLPTQ